MTRHSGQQGTLAKLLRNRLRRRACLPLASTSTMKRAVPARGVERGGLWAKRRRKTRVNFVFVLRSGISCAVLLDDGNGSQDQGTSHKLPGTQRFIEEQ